MSGYESNALCGDLSCLLQTHCHLNISGKLLVSRQIFRDRWRNRLWQWLEDRCSKQMQRVCPECSVHRPPYTHTGHLTHTQATLNTHRSPWTPTGTTDHPTYTPTGHPTGHPTHTPTGHPTYTPTGHPNYIPTGHPTHPQATLNTHRPLYTPTGHPTHPQATLLTHP